MKLGTIEWLLSFGEQQQITDTVLALSVRFLPRLGLGGWSSLASVDWTGDESLTQRPLRHWLAADQSDFFPLEPMNEEIGDPSKEDYEGG